MGEGDRSKGRKCYYWSMIINDEKVGKYCDEVGHEVIGSNCPYPHSSGLCPQHWEVLLDGICKECYEIQGILSMRDRVPRNFYEGNA